MFQLQKYLQITFTILSVPNLLEICASEMEVSNSSENEIGQRKIKGGSEITGVCSMFSAKFPLIGTLVLTEGKQGLKITGTLNSLPRMAQLGFHVHTYGNFSDLTNMCDSLGPHFNPFGKPHGCPGDDNKHAGDLGNIETDANGVSKVSITSKSISLKKGEKCILGRSIVVHMMTDDCGKGGNMASEMNGNSGPRIACCAIGISM